MNESGWWDVNLPVELNPLLWHRRWWWNRKPFPHVRAVNVFRPEVYLQLEKAFAGWLTESGGGAPLSGHDLQGTTMTESFAGPLRLFASTGWRLLLARLFDTPATRHVNVGLHHHRPGSAPGFAHNDLNPGWFPVASADERTVLAKPAQVEYTTGRRDEGVPAVRVVRAVAVLFYLANPSWEPEHAGRTALYDGPGSDRLPTSAVPPHSNSLLAFECTPWSYHGFEGGGTMPRNSVVMWLHRPVQAVVRRWGTDKIVGYGSRS